MPPRFPTLTNRAVDFPRDRQRQVAVSDRTEVHSAHSFRFGPHAVRTVAPFSPLVYLRGD